MKIKWNWGTGIFVGGSIFMLMIIVFVFFMFKQNFDLVEKDYYPKSLEYQQKMDKINHTNLLPDKVKVQNNDGILSFTFPSSINLNNLTGTITFYRPSEKEGDITIAIDTDTAGMISFATDKLLKGRYIIKMDYECESKGYYQEESLVVQ